MSDSRTSEKWIETGYQLFAEEGPEGIQIERLARILGLNKSGFYHYFGDLENYSKVLVDFHYRMFDRFIDDVVLCRNIDPDYLNVLIKHKIMVMCQIHLVRNQTNPKFNKVYEELNEKIGRAILTIWAEHIDIPTNPDLAFTYHSLVRDVFYSRVNLVNFNYNYLKALSDESREVVTKILQEERERIAKSEQGYVH